MKRTIGLAELNEFARVINEIAVAMPGLRGNVTTAQTLVDGAPLMPNADGALYATLVGTAGAVAIADRYRTLLEAFARAAYDYLGERPASGESLQAFLWRISATDTSGLKVMQWRNGVIFKA